jgi:hypothetical protein
MRVRFQADADLDGRILRGCDGQRPRSTFALLAMLALRVWEIRKFCGSQRTPGEFLSARIGGRCLHISLASPLALRVPESFCYAKQPPSRPRSRSLSSSGMPAKLKNGPTDSCGYRFKNFPPGLLPFFLLDLPANLDLRVTGEGGVCCHQRKILHHRLCRNHPVKRIFVPFG